MLYEVITPRLINQLCDVAMVYGFSDEAPKIDFSIIYEVAASRESMGLTPFRPLPADVTKDGLRATLGNGNAEPAPAASPAPSDAPQTRPNVRNNFV